MNEFQLDMTLNKNSNPFKNALDNGNFVFLAESAPPENEQNINSAVERMMPLAETMLRQEDLCGGLAVTDYYGSPWSAADSAAWTKPPTGTARWAGSAGRISPTAPRIPWNR